MSARRSTTEARAQRARTRKLEAAWDAFDAANRDDPHTIEVRGEGRPKELAHAELVTEWVSRLHPEASDALLLAARAHHIRRWVIPRERYPKHRAGYLRWREELQQLHATVAGAILRDVGYDDDIIARVQDILQKRGLGRDSEVQAFEDALCLTFLETQLTAFSEGLPNAKAQAVLEKTVRKMSPAGRRHALELSLPAAARATLLVALAVAEG